MTYSALKDDVSNRGKAPDAFLAELVAWGRTADEAIFAANANHDIYTNIKDTLGPWQGPEHRRAVMLEVLRVLAGFESSWHWNAGRDTTNPTSDQPDTTEAGAWQVSANSMNFAAELKALVQTRVGSTDGLAFQKAMKADHVLAMDYVARLLRHTTNHHGPVKRHEIDAWLRVAAVDEFMELLGSP